MSWPSRNPVCKCVQQAHVADRDIIHSVAHICNGFREGGSSPPSLLISIQKCQRHLPRLWIAFATSARLAASAAAGLSRTWRRGHSGTPGLPLAMFGFRFPASDVFRSRLIHSTSICTSHLACRGDCQSSWACDRPATCRAAPAPFGPWVQR